MAKRTTKKRTTRKKKVPKRSSSKKKSQKSRKSPTKKSPAKSSADVQVRVVNTQVAKEHSRKKMKTAAVAAIISAIIALPAVIFSVAAGILPVAGWAAVVAIVLGLALSVTSILVLRGYLEVARLASYASLRSMAIWMILLEVVGIVFLLVSPGKGAWAVADMLLLLISGLLLVIFGIVFLKLRKKAGGLVTALGVIYIIQGGLFLSVLFVGLGVLLAVVASILEAVFFFKAVKIAW